MCPVTVMSPIASESTTNRTITDAHRGVSAITAPMKRTAANAIPSHRCQKSRSLGYPPSSARNQPATTEVIAEIAVAQTSSLRVAVMRSGFLKMVIISTMASAATMPMGIWTNTGCSRPMNMSQSVSASVLIIMQVSA